MFFTEDLWHYHKLSLGIYIIFLTNFVSFYQNNCTPKDYKGSTRPFFSTHTVTIPRLIIRIHVRYFKSTGVQRREDPRQKAIT